MALMHDSYIIFCFFLYFIWVLINCSKRNFNIIVNITFILFIQHILWRILKLSRDWNFLISNYNAINVFNGEYFAVWCVSLIKCTAIWLSKRIIFINFNFSIKRCFEVKTKLQYDAHQLQSFRRESTSEFYVSTYLIHFSKIIGLISNHLQSVIFGL